MDHQRYLIVGADNSSTEAIQTLFGNSYPYTLEIAELTYDEVELLDSYRKDQKISRHSILW